MRHPYGQTVTIVRSSPGGFTPEGDPVSGTTTETAIPGCAIAPRMSSEPTERGRQGVIVGFTVYLPYGTDVLFTDQVKIGGLPYSIEGDVGNWLNPFTGATPGGEIAVKRAVG